MMTQTMTAVTCARCSAANDARVFCMNCGLYLRDESGIVERVTFTRRFFGSYLLEGVLVLLTLLIGWVIWFAFQAPKARTPAKSLTGLYVIDLETGRAASAGQMWLREIVVKVIVISVVNVFVGIAGIVDAVWVFFDKNRQTLHDKILNQVVVYAPHGLPASMLSENANYAAPPPMSPAQPDDVATQLRELSRLHDERILTDEEYERKRSELAGKL